MESPQHEIFENDIPLVRANAMITNEIYNYDIDPLNIRDVDISSSSSSVSSMSESSAPSISSASQSVIYEYGGVSYDDNSDSSDVNGQNEPVIPFAGALLSIVVALFAVIEYPRFPTTAAIIGTLLIIFTQRRRILDNRRTSFGIFIYMMCAAVWFNTGWQKHAALITIVDGQEVASTTWKYFHNYAINNTHRAILWPCSLLVSFVRQHVIPVVSTIFV